MTTEIQNLNLELEFKAPRAKVWAAWTEVSQLVQWFAPEGWTVRESDAVIDARVGGKEHFVMHSIENPEMQSPVDAVFTEVSEPSLLVGQTEATPQNGGSVMELRVELEEIDANNTRMKVTQGPYAADILPLAEQGWGSTMGKLRALLEG
ncbi:SRPBCC family protein [Neomicrococcus lactis]